MTIHCKIGPNVVVLFTRHYYIIMDLDFALLEGGT